MNKRRFRKSLAQNAIYMKYKRVIAINTETGNTFISFNFNGAEATAGPTSVICSKSGPASPVGYTVATDMVNLSPIYDQNRCAAIKVKWFPAMPPGSVHTQYGLAFIIKDRDGIDGNLASYTTTDPYAVLEQVNGVKTRNMYQPFKVYMKAPKHRINSRIPSFDPAYATAAQGYSPNTNLAGQWKRVNASLTAQYDGSDIINRGPQLGIIIPPAGSTTSQIEGRLEVTTYYVYKDRQ